MVANKKKTVKKKNTIRMLFLGLGSIVIIITMTLTIGKYWVDIFYKYPQEKNLLFYPTLLRNIYKKAIFYHKYKRLYGQKKTHHQLVSAVDDVCGKLTS